MPGPVPKSVTGFSGGASNVARAEPACMAQVAAVAVAWTEIELKLVYLIDGALGAAHIQDGGAVGLAGNWVAKLAMQQAETIRMRIKLVDATVQPMLEGTDLAQRWIDLKTDLRSRSRERNEIVHANWHFASELPGEVIRHHKGQWERWALKDFSEVQRRFHRLAMAVMALTHDIGLRKAQGGLSDLPSFGTSATSSIGDSM